VSVVDGSSGIRYTAEQLAAITAPLEPGVIVAGAGSGKTTVMAARVVWLVEQGLVAPGEVLGLTFTNKAAAELRERVLAGLRKAGLIGLPEPGDPRGAPGAAGDDDADDPAEAAEPVISTYHAYARALIREHGLRLGIEPSTQLLGDARRFTLAAAAVRAAAGPFEALTAPLPDLVRDLIELDGQLSEHVVGPDRLRAHDLAFVQDAERHRNADGSYKRGYATLRDAVARARERLELLTLVEDYRAAKRAREVMDFGDQMALGTRLAEQAPEVGRTERGKYRVVLLDEYQDTSVAQRRMLVALFGGEPPEPDTEHVEAEESGFGHAVTAVGDPCQSIYGWRGASAANIDHFPEHFPRRVRGAAPGSWSRAPARVYTLTENRRSGGRLLSFANARSEVLREHHTGVSALKPMVEKAELGRSVVAVLPDYRSEVSWIGDQIEALRTADGQTTPWKQVAVLVRKGAQIPELYAELHGRGIPVEVVGLSGLLHLPEIADLTAMLDVVDDPISNASLVRLLTGPRWRIGPRDLALLGRRARELVRAPDDDARRAESLEQAAARTDPIDVVSLCDAVEDPGDRLPFSGAALARFERFAAEIRRLRRSLAEPVPDLLQRILQETGLDVEIAASPEAFRRRCADTVGAFRSVAANFTGLDGEQSATAFRAFLKACAEHERGLDIDLPPTDADTVKILTMHKAKGLEWDVVAVPHQFAEAPRSEPWTGHRARVPNPLRGDAAELAVLGGRLDKAAFDRFTAEVKGEAALEDDRLSYVTLTRPRAKLIVSAHRWGPSQKTPRRPSPMLEKLREHCLADPANGEVAAWAEEPAEGEENPALAVREVPWPLDPSGPAVELRREAARAVYRELRRLERSAAKGTDGASERSAPERSASEPGVPEPREERLELEDPRQRAVADGWDADIEALLDEARRAGQTRYEVPMPTSLSATRLLSLAADRRAFAEQLFRPMPRPPAPHARRGTEFHAWVEQRFGQQTLFDEEDLDLFADQEEVEGAADLAGLKEAFLRTEYAQREPYRVEAPFQLLLNPPGAAPVIVRGRIDAVYRRTGGPDGGPGGYEVVDWKTNRRATADPLQLAVYRIAWAELAGVPIEEVSAAFLYVRTGQTVRPADLPDRAALEALLAEPAQPAPEEQQASA
jgi:DNA helicase-2/ATP-dependent DNA helicase PcrA